MKKIIHSDHKIVIIDTAHTMVIKNDFNRHDNEHKTEVSVSILQTKPNLVLLEHVKSSRGQKSNEKLYEGNAIGTFDNAFDLIVAKYIWHIKILLISFYYYIVSIHYFNFF